MDKKTMDVAFLGHPRGLATLFFTEMWERFSYYGMRAILLFYMYYSVVDGGLGFDKVTAASIMSIYGALVYLSSAIGGFVSDRVWGSRRTVFVGGILIMLGHIALSTPFGRTALFISMGLIVIGTGLLKPNVSTMVGDLYGETDPRRDTGFTIFVFGINTGAVISPILVGYLGQNINFHLGFSLAAIGMFFGLLQYYIDGKKYLSKDSLYPSDPIDPEELKGLLQKILIFVVSLSLIFIIMSLFNLLNLTNIILVITILAVMIPIYYFIIMLSSSKLTKKERSRVWAYVPLFIASILFWSIEEQGSVVLAFFAQEQTKLSIGWLHYPASVFQSMNPLFIMIYVPFFAIFWTKLGDKQPSSPAKFAYGLFFAGLSFIWMMIPGFLSGTSTRVSPFWLIISWALVIIGEMLISPIGLSATTKLAPKAFRSQMMSMWFLSDAVAQAFNSQLVRFYSKDTEVMYYGLVGIVTIIFGVVLLLMVPRIKKLMIGVR
ncbi:Di- tripeptide transporter [Liquorilactobacillus aquaticus DSM 21051]|uniref:Di-/tripeptide transporter n=1 Tax=Liquorilactobacillus aquaticus DSM 21051 TaxID=1423725 RepID=A0A0R2D274_9LACO|nr:peptide MFS transporter [Liquorilactobacillus aquaticus]KRM95988.1 Di- tripeptide transporter [Liquorilactobacillus aquaticus DSM 21051]